MKIEKPKGTGELLNATAVGKAKSSAGFALVDFKGITWICPDYGVDRPCLAPVNPTLLN